MYSFCAMYSFRMSFCSVPESCAHVHALLLGDRQVHGPEDRRRRVDGHGDRDIAERNAAEEDLHVFERADGGAALADFAFAQGMVGVVAHQRGQIERHREPGLALLQQIVVAAVGFFGRGEAGELPHGPELAAVHVAVDAARVRKLAGRRQFARQIDPGQVFRDRRRLDRHSANCRKLAFGGFHQIPSYFILYRHGTIEHETPMLKPTIFREYDIRGVADDGAARRRHRAARPGLRDLPAAPRGKNINLGRDTRLSSPRLRDALMRGLKASGCDVTDIGVVPTPVLYYSVFHLKADGGVMITGSHNPSRVQRLQDGVRRVHHPRRGHPGNAPHDRDRRSGDAAKARETTADVVTPYVDGSLGAVPVSAAHQGGRRRRQRHRRTGDAPHSREAERGCDRDVLRDGRPLSRITIPTRPCRRTWRR